MRYIHGKKKFGGQQSSSLLLSSIADISPQVRIQSSQPNAEVQIERGIQLFSPQYLSYYPTNPYDVGTQKNHLTETNSFEFEYPHHRVSGSIKDFRTW